MAWYSILMKACCRILSIILFLCYLTKTKLTWSRKTTRDAALLCAVVYFLQVHATVFKSYSRQVRKKWVWLSMHWARFLNVKFNIFINALNKRFTTPPFTDFVPSSFIYRYLNVFICTTWKHGPVCTAVLYIHKYSVSCGFCTFKAHPPAAARHCPGRQV